jgi:NAD(P)H-dependent flavin oxidoreductase YrpB (nitropropane dioxygenase family)
MDLRPSSGERASASGCDNFIVCHAPNTVLKVDLMHFLEQIKLIQGGMGVYVSNWRLAKAVAAARPGATAGTVSGTALDVVYVRLLQLGDPGGHARRALAAFDNAFGTGIGQTICERYFIDGGKAPDARFKSTPMQIIRAQALAVRGSSSAPAAVPLHLPEEVVELLITTGFAEVWLAKEGHQGNIFINFVNKIELPLMYVLYGAMLAGVDGVVVGAGNPDGLPARCSQLAHHAAVTKQLPVLYQEAGEAFTLTVDPQQLYNGAFTKNPLKRPAFLTLVALDGLVQALAASAR